MIKNKIFQHIKTAYRRKAIRGFCVSVTGGLFAIDGDDEHEGGQGILKAFDVYDVGIGPLPKLLGDGGDLFACGVVDTVVPFPKASFYAPTVAVDFECRLEEAEFLGDTAKVNILLIEIKFRQKGTEAAFDRSELVLYGVVNFQSLHQCRLALDGKKDVAVFIINVIAAPKGKHTLLKDQFHGYTSLFVFYSIAYFCRNFKIF